MLGAHMQKGTRSFWATIYKIMYGVTRIPIRAGQHTHIRLTSYAREQLENAKPDSITGW